MTTRMSLIGAAACLAVLGTALAGCEDGRMRPPPTGVRIVHAAPTTGPIDVLREELATLVDNMEYRGSSALLSFDSGQYDFNVEITDPRTGQPDRVKSFSRELLAENTYLFVLTEIAGSVEPIIVENPVFDSDTDTQVAAMHAAPSLPAMDVYLEPPAADLSTATPLGSVAFNEYLEPATREPGDYRLTLTAAGDPATVLLSSTTIALDAGESNSFVIVDDAGDGVAPFSVVVSGPAATLLYDRSVRSGLVAVNAAADGAARDVAVDGDYAAPLIPALAYTAASALASIAPGTRELSVTPAGNPGVVEDEAELAAVRGNRYTALVAGEPGSVTIAVAQDDARPLAEQARIRFMNGASQFTPLEFFLVTEGTDITNRMPLSSLVAPGIGSRISAPPGDYELTLRDADTDAIVAGPQPITVGVGLYAILAINGAASGTVDVVLLEEGFN